MRKIGLFLSALFFFCISVQLQAQSTQANVSQLNNYKYVVIPIQFDFQSEENQYMINSKLKYLLNQHGFTTYMDVEDLPLDLRANSCSALHADLKSDAEGFLAMQTKLRLQLKDCRNQVVFESQEGVSRAKDYKDGYLEALDDLFDSSFANVIYQYNGTAPEQSPASEKTDVVSETPKAVAQLEGLASTKDRIYTLDGGTEAFGVHKIAAGYLLLNEATGDRIAMLNETDENTILYNSKTVNGTATLKEGGRIIKVEYFDAQKGEVQTLTYTEKE